METRDAMRSCRSVNSYLDKKVNNDVVAEILDIAKNAPSSGNLQNWKVVVVDDKEKISKIATCCLDQRWISQAPVLIVICNDYENVNRMYGTRGKDLYSVQNCAAFIQNILLISKDFGLCSCWVGSYDPASLRSLLRIPDNVRPEAVITLGYSDEVKKSTRNETHSFSFLNEYGNKISLKAPASFITEKMETVKKKGFFSNLFRK